MIAEKLLAEAETTLDRMRERVNELGELNTSLLAQEMILTRKIASFLESIAVLEREVHSCKEMLEELDEAHA